MSFHECWSCTLQMKRPSARRQQRWRWRPDHRGFLSLWCTTSKWVYVCAITDLSSFAFSPVHFRNEDLRCLANGRCTDTLTPATGSRIAVASGQRHHPVGRQWRWRWRWHDALSLGWLIVFEEDVGVKLPFLRRSELRSGYKASSQIMRQRKVVWLSEPRPSTWHPQRV